MAAKLYFVRHGQTVANKAQLYDGQELNSPLNDTGVKQAEALVEPLQLLGIERIISSPLIRARQTAEIITAGLGLPEPLSFDARLMEGAKGVVSNTPYRHIPIEALLQYENVEDSQVFQERVKAALSEAAQGDKITLIVSHGGVYSQYRTIHDKLPANDFWAMASPDNGLVLEIDVNWQ